MNYLEFKQRFKELPPNYKTKDVDSFNKKLIKEKIDVSFLKDYILNHQEYHRTYFQVSLSYLKNYEEKYKFIEDNYFLLNDWWHVDQLTQFIQNVDLKYAYRKAKKYIKSSHPFLRRWGYVQFIPTLVKKEDTFDLIVNLLKDDDEYYVVMAEAWLISFLAMYHFDKTLEYLKNTTLKYNIVGRAIQKICDSHVISEENKNIFKEIRKRYK